MNKYVNNKKIIIFAHHPAPYRDYFFSKLQRENVDFLVVYYYDHPPTHNEWEKQTTFEYNSFIFNKKRTLNLPVLGDFHLQLFKYIFKRNIVFVIPGYLPLTSLILLVYCYIFRISFIYSADTVFKNNRMINKTFKLLILSKLISSATAIWVPGLASEEYHRKLTKNRVPILKGVYFLDPYDLEQEDESENDAIKNIPLDGRFNFLFIGKLIPSRNIKLLCDAFNLLPQHLNANLIVVGDGSQSYIVQKYSEKNRNIFWIESLKFDEIHHLYRVSNAYIHPGEEPYSLALQEAFWLDVPMIASYRVGATADLLINNVNGFLIETLDAYSIYLKMRLIIESPLNPKTLRQNNEKIRLKFNVDHFIKDFINYI